LGDTARNDCVATQQERSMQPATNHSAGVCAYRKNSFLHLLKGIISQKIQNIIINTLRAYDADMFGVFGSNARNENTGESDHILEAIIKFKISPQEFPDLSLTEMS
jgi:hypothetical protein